MKTSWQSKHFLMHLCLPFQPCLLLYLLELLFIHLQFFASPSVLCHTLTSLQCLCVCSFFGLFSLQAISYLYILQVTALNSPSDSRWPATLLLCPPITYFYHRIHPSCTDTFVNGLCSNQEKALPVFFCFQHLTKEHSRGSAFWTN